MERLLDAVRRLLDPVPEAAGALADWPQGAARRAVKPGMLPVCDGIGSMTGTPATEPVLREVQRLAAGLAWRQTYGVAEFGAAFLRGYGWSEFIGLRGPVPSDRIAVGVLLLGPGVTYPPHAHAAAEVYVPLSGVAQWQRGTAAFALGPVGQAIHHPPWMAHAMRTGAEPLAAIYLWWGGDLAAKSVVL